MSRSLDRVRLRNALNRGDITVGDSSTDTASMSIDAAAELGKGISGMVAADRKKKADEEAKKKGTGTKPVDPKPGEGGPKGKSKQSSSGFPMWGKVALGVGGGLLGLGVVVHLVRRK